jgi:L-aminopeptidase/D-esterase-like protein
MKRRQVGVFAYCTVVLVEGDGAPGGVSQRGGAPGTRETNLLDPLNLVDKVNAIVLSGGSAFGLDASQGVMRYLEEKKIGWNVGAAGVVPIVPAAILFDLGFGGDPKIRPTADCGYKAAGLASDGAVAEGNVGAGAGATVGKVAGRDRSMKGGLGTAAVRLPNGLTVAALVAVNAVGDVIDHACHALACDARRRVTREHGEARRLFLGVGHEREHSGFEALARLALVDAARDAPDQIIHLVGDDGGVEPFLRAKVLIDNGLGHACFGCDFFDSGRFVAVFGKKTPTYVQ